MNLLRSAIYCGGYGIEKLCLEKRIMGFQIICCIEKIVATAGKM